MPNHELTPWTEGGRRLSRYGDDPFISFRKQMDRLFDDFLSPYPAEPPAIGAMYGAAQPSLEVRDTGKAFEVAAELPGLEQKDVQVEVKDNVLIIRGEKRAERKEEDGVRTWSERAFGRFQRVLPLDAEVDADKADARFKNGLLMVTLPKNPRAQDRSHKIAIH